MECSWFILNFLPLWSMIFWSLHGLHPQPVTKALQRNWLTDVCFYCISHTKYHSCLIYILYFMFHALCLTFPALSVSSACHLSDPNESGIHPFSLHLHHSRVQPWARISHITSLQATPGGPSWLWEGGKDWSGGPDTHRGQVYQPVSALPWAGQNWAQIAIAIQKQQH